jgi:p-cumate 2,3-dioxygenase beta subunit
MESAHDGTPTEAREESSMSTQLPSRQEAEDLLYKEAALLDEWRLDEWLELLTEDATYEIPPTDVPEGDSRNTLFIIADDALRIRSRVKQLLGKAAWAENPHSRTRRMISNVRVVAAEGENILVTANFAVFRMRYESVDTYIGHYDYKLVRAANDLRIRERRAVLDNERYARTAKSASSCNQTNSRSRRRAQWTSSTCTTTSSRPR